MAVRMVCAISAILIALGIGGTIRWYDETVGSVVAPIVVFFIGLPAMIFGIWRVDQTYRRFPALVLSRTSKSDGYRHGQLSELWTQGVG